MFLHVLDIASDHPSNRWLTWVQGLISSPCPIVQFFRGNLIQSSSQPRVSPGSPESSIGLPVVMCLPHLTWRHSNQMLQHPFLASFDVEQQ